MIHVHFAGALRSARDETQLRGRLYQGPDAVPADALHALCAGWGGVEGWAEGLRAASGCFALVHRRGDEVLAAVDRARSIPLFYALHGGDAWLSDDAHWVAERTGAAEGQEPAATEFLLGGFVSGRDTLAAGVHQLPAGDLLRLRDDGAAVHAEPHRWFRFLHHPDREAGEAVLAERLDAALLTVFARLADYAGGRTIAVPLSGGYDSRLALAMLRRLEYPRLLAFTYGRPHNREAVISQEVARQLGVPWHFVEYDNEQWRRWFLSEDRRRYYRMADGLSSLPLLQDWPAVGVLRARGTLPEDTVFAPGLSADIPAGSRSKRYPELYRPELPPREEVVRALVRSGFGLWDWSRREDEWYPLLAERVADSLGEYADFPDGASALESWESRERVSKYVVNSVRAYEFWGYDWWIPFWDREFLDFWTTVPVEMRLRKRLYTPYVERVFAAQAGVQREAQPPAAHHGSLLPRAKRWVLNTPLYPLARDAYRQLRARSEYDRHLLAWFGAVPREVLRGTAGWNSLASFLAADRLGRLDLSGNGNGSRRPVALP